MKITLYNSKGSVGKTPIAVELALRLNYAIATNEPSHNYLYKVFPKERVLSVLPSEAFPELPSDIDIVFDLGGFLGGSETSIVSAIEQSDLVIIPVYNETCSLEQTIFSISEVEKISRKIIIIATKLEKNDLDEIEKEIRLNIKTKYPIFPLKKSKIFKHILKKGESIKDIRNKNGLQFYIYESVYNQFEDIYKFLLK